jgi:hypothetical protein
MRVGWLRCSARDRYEQSKNQGNELACGRSSAGNRAADCDSSTRPSSGVPSLPNQRKRAAPLPSIPTHVATPPATPRIRLRCCPGAQSIWRFWSSLRQNPGLQRQSQRVRGCHASHRLRVQQKLTSCCLRCFNSAFRSSESLNAPQLGRFFILWKACEKQVRDQNQGCKSPFVSVLRFHFSRCFSFGVH